MGRYPRLEERGRELLAVMDHSRYSTDEWYFAASEHHGICCFFGAGGKGSYEFALAFAKERGFAEVVDIGCAYATQSEVFIGSGVGYTGVDVGDLPFWNRDRFRFIVGEYPFRLEVNKENTLAVSVLCIGWFGPIDGMLWQLAEDFNHALIYMPDDAVETAGQYWVAEKVREGMFYLKKGEKK